MSPERYDPNSVNAILATLVENSKINSKIHADNAERLKELKACMDDAIANTDESLKAVNRRIDKLVNLKYYIAGVCFAVGTIATFVGWLLHH